ncbi:MAG: hypothetical protein MJZ34_16250 [Paludibacteraceae bacterium]|nr:hypothetical protein [Paludibacteraceae bacterium]MCQ2217214.1 hypothetical protein [Paludibacteraceae bacterium]
MTNNGITLIGNNSNMVKFFFLLLVIVLSYSVAYSEEEKTPISNKAEIIDFAKQNNLAFSDFIDEYEFLHYLEEMTERTNDIYIADDRIYNLLILCMKEGNSKNIVYQCSQILAEKGNPRILREKSKEIKKRISIEQIIPLACYLDLTGKEKKVVLEKSDLFGRAYLGDEVSVQKIGQKFRASDDIGTRMMLAKQLGIINSKLSISILLEDFGKDEYTTLYNEKYSKKYWFPFAMQYVDGEYQDYYFSKMLSEFRDRCVVYADEGAQPEYECKCGDFQREFLDRIRVYALKRYGIKLPKIKKNDLLFYIERMEVE